MAHLKNNAIFDRACCHLKISYPFLKLPVAPCYQGAPRLSLTKYFRDRFSQVSLTNFFREGYI